MSVSAELLARFRADAERQRKGQREGRPPAREGRFRRGPPPLARARHPMHTPSDVTADSEDAYYAAMMEGADLASSEQLEEAEAAFERAAELAQGIDQGRGRPSAEAVMQLGAVRAERGAHEPALEAVDRALAIANGLEPPDSVLLGQIHLSRAGILAGLDRIDEGIADAEASVEHLKTARGRGAADDVVSQLLDASRDVLEQMVTHRDGA